MKKDLEASTNSVSQFHAELNNEDYQSIYSQADQRFRDASKREDLFQLLGAVHRKLGTVQGAERQNFHVNFNTSGTQVVVTYNTKFSGGDAVEEFVWAKDGDTLRLLHYNINSNALIVR